MIGAMTDMERAPALAPGSTVAGAAAAPRLRGRAALLALLLAGLAFTALAADLLWHGPLTAADPAISSWFHAHARPAFTAAMRTVSDLHRTWVLLAATAVAALALVLRRERRWAVALVVCVPSGMVLNSLVKDLFQRPRPAFDHPLVTPVTYSFPSGHTSGAALAWGFALVWLFAQRRDARARLLGCAVAVTMVLLTALSRVALGAHYVSDVLAAGAEGVAWLALCLFVLTPLLWRET